MEPYGVPSLNVQNQSMRLYLGLKTFNRAATRPTTTTWISVASQKYRFQNMGKASLNYKAYACCKIKSGTRGRYWQ